MRVTGKIAIASDHAGFQLKEILKKHLTELGYEYEDFGANSEESSDFPDFALPVADSVSKKKFELGILICGAGIGMCIAANKLPGIRAAVCYDVETAKLARGHTDTNILALGGRLLTPERAKKIVSAWLAADFIRNERYVRRIDKIGKIEAQYMK